VGEEKSEAEIIADRVLRLCGRDEAMRLLEQAAYIPDDELFALLRYVGIADPGPMNAEAQEGCAALLSSDSALASAAYGVLWVDRGVFMAFPYFIFFFQQLMLSGPRHR
jgi:hypothetical protein